MNNKIIFDLEKFKVIIHYIIGRYGFQENVGRVVLFKLLYFSDFDNYELYENSISGKTYLKKRMGPVPSHFQEVISELKNEGKINETIETVINFPKYKYSSLTKQDTGILSSNELQVIDDTINRISPFLSKEISEYSDGYIPWRIEKDGEAINYEAVFYRNPEYSVRDYGDE